MANIRLSKFFNSLERSNRPSEMFWPEKTETSCVKKVIEPLGKSDKRLQAASDLPKKMPRIRVAQWGPVTGGKLDVFFNRDVIPMQQR